MYINARKQLILIPAPTSNDFILIRCWVNKYYWFLSGNLLYDKLLTSTAWLPPHVTTNYPFQCWQPTGTPQITGETFYNRAIFHVGSVCYTYLFFFYSGSQRFSCGIFSSTVKIQAMECSIVVGCYESPVGLRTRTLKRFREQTNSKT